MTILEPILYANGALRLTRHGAGKGDTVLLFTHHDGVVEQFTVPDAETRDLADDVETLCNRGVPVADVFAVLQRDFAPLGNAITPITSPNFYHD